MKENSRKEIIGPILASIGLLIVLLIFLTWTMEGNFFLSLPFSIVAMYFIMVIGVGFGFTYLAITSKNQRREA
ncbi:MAG: hypothetical protein KAI86_11335 [Desulfobacterales bacterium]|jgi:hypothetical protein|nr:hypothetical protein [Desulfobacterales bacterium]